MIDTPTVRTELGWRGCAWACLLLLATISGCYDAGEPPPIADRARPVKTLVVSAPSADASIELPGRVQAAQQVDLAFEGVGGRIVELPNAERERQQVLKGELLAQIDPKDFRTALADAEDNLREAYSVLDLAQAEEERMRKMKSINPDLVSASMLERTGKNLRQAEARIDSLEAAVEKAEASLENTSLRAPFDGIVIRSLVRDLQTVQAGQAILSLQDTGHLEVLIEGREALMAAIREAAPHGLSAIGRFPSQSDEAFPLTIKETASAPNPGTGASRLVLEMSKPKDIELPPGTTGTVSVGGEGSGMRLTPILVPAISVMTDPDGKNYVWLVDEAQLRAHRRDIQVGGLSGSDQIQVLTGLAGGERIVVAGVMQLSEGRLVRLWDEQQDSGEAR
jgi:RND family efflux transporter MFP subunit